MSRRWTHNRLLLTKLPLLKKLKKMLKVRGVGDNCNARVNPTNANFSNLFSSVALTNQFGVFPNHKIAPCIIVVVANSCLFNADSCK